MRTVPAALVTLALLAARPAPAGDDDALLRDVERMAQLQADLEDAGHQVVGPARSLAQGLLLAEQEDIDAALVDISLGRDSSVPIADRLLARSVPFAFATGYADSTMLPEHLRRIPRLSKPYAPQEVRRILDRLVMRSS